MFDIQHLLRHICRVIDELKISQVDGLHPCSSYTCKNIEVVSCTKIISDSESETSRDSDSDEGFEIYQVDGGYDKPLSKKSHKSKYNGHHHKQASSSDNNQKYGKDHSSRPGKSDSHENRSAYRQSSSYYAHPRQQEHQSHVQNNESQYHRKKSHKHSSKHHESSRHSSKEQNTHSRSRNNDYSNVNTGLSYSQEAHFGGSSKPSTTALNVVPVLNMARFQHVPGIGQSMVVPALTSKKPIALAGIDKMPRSVLNSSSSSKQNTTTTTISSSNTDKEDDIVMEALNMADLTFAEEIPVVNNQTVASSGGNVGNILCTTSSPPSVEEIECEVIEPQFIAGSENSPVYLEAVDNNFNVAAYSTVNSTTSGSPLECSVAEKSDDVRSRLPSAVNSSTTSSTSKKKK